MFIVRVVGVVHVTNIERLRIEKCSSILGRTYLITQVTQNQSKAYNDELLFANKYVGKILNSTISYKTRLT